AAFAGAPFNYLAIDALCLFRIPLELVGSTADLALGFRQRLAGLERHDHGDLVCTAADKLGRGADKARALPWSGPPPDLEPGFSGGKRRIEVLFIGGGNSAQHLFGCRISDLTGGAARCRAPVTVDIKLQIAIHCGASSCQA